MNALRRQEDRSAIQRGIDDMEAGRGMSAEEAEKHLREKLGFPPPFCAMTFRVIIHDETPHGRVAGALRETEAPGVRTGLLLRRAPPPPYRSQSLSAAAGNQRDDHPPQRGDRK